MWRKGRGKLGIFDPLIGAWEAESDSERGRIRCEREFTRSLNGAYVQLHAVWHVGPKSHVGPKPYEEIAFYGLDADGWLGFWSFTSDGKQSRGFLVTAPDLPSQSLVFEAQMPAGLARMAYWPDEAEGDGFRFAVESRNRNGWKRFVEHGYRRMV